MGRQSSGPWKVVVRLENSPQRVIPIPARFVNVQLAELLEHLPAGHLSPTIRPAVVRHGLGVLNPHVLEHRLEPRPHKLTAPMKPVRTPVAILGSLGVCIYVPASRHWLISYSPIHLI